MYNKTVFIKRLTKPMLPIEKWHKHPKTKSKTLPGASEPKLDRSSHVEFSPVPLDKNLSRSIIEQACSRIKSVKLGVLSVESSGCYAEWID